MSFHRVCCCASCPETLEVTFSGVDAAICSHCRTLGAPGAPFQSTKMNTLSVDGAYTVSFDQIDVGTGYCEYSYSLTSSNFGSFDRWASGLCPGAADNNITLDRINIVVTLDPVTLEFDLIAADVQGTFSGSDLSWRAFEAVATGKTYGEAVSNAMSCSGNGGSSGGTATVTIP